MTIKSRQDFAPLINWSRYTSAAEIGTFRGVYSLFLLENSDLAILYSVDPWAEGPGIPPGKADGIHQQAIRRLDRFGARSQILRKTSAQAAADIDPARPLLDFVYLDADPHTAESTDHDIRAWWPLVAPGGILAGHDYSQAAPHFGVIDAVDDFEEREGIPVYITGARRPGRPIRHAIAALAKANALPEDVDEHPSWYCWKPSA